jgi:hypothetical protein
MATENISNDLTTLLDGARGVLADTYFSTQEVAVAIVGDVVHSVCGYCSAVRALIPKGAAGPDQDKVVSISIDELESMVRCEACWGRYAFESQIVPGYGPSKAPWVTGMWCAVRLSGAVRALGGYLEYYDKHGKFRSTKATGEWLHKAKLLLAQIERLYPVDPPPYEVAEMIGDLEGLVSRLTARTGSDSEYVNAKRRAVLDRVNKAATPSWYRGPVPACDESPVLMGISPAPSVLSGSAVCTAVFKEMVLARSDDGVVLCVPRFVADYLNSGNAWKRTRPLRGSLVQIVSVDAGVSQGVLEVAASIWDPQSSGTLADLTAAVDTAVLLDAQSRGASA